MSKLQVPAPGSSLVVETDWAGYVTAVEALQERRLRMTYDRGKMEIMAPSQKHEKIKEYLGILIQTALEAFGQEYVPGGSTTFNRQDRQSGLEPDTCFWIARWRDVLGFGPWIPGQHPPPDLAVEVEVTSHLLNRISVYQSLEVPEIWRWSAEDRLLFLRRNAAQYEECPRSQFLPTLPAEEIEHQIGLAATTGTVQWKRGLRKWIEST